MIGILDVALVVAMCLGAIILIAVLFRYILYRPSFDTIDIIMCLLAFAFVMGGFIKTIRFGDLVIDIGRLLPRQEPTAAELALDRIANRLDVLVRDMEKRGQIQTPPPVPLPESAPKVAQRVVIISEPSMTADAHRIRDAVANVAQKNYRIESVVGSLASVRAALPSDASIFIRLISRSSAIAERDSILKVLRDAGYSGKVEASTWPLANGDVQLQIFDR